MVLLFQLLTQEQQMVQIQLFQLSLLQVVVEEVQDMMELIQVITMEVQEVQAVEQVEKMVEHLQVQEIALQYRLHKVMVVEHGVLLIGEVAEEERPQQVVLDKVDLAEMVQAQELIQHLQ